jgi:hypothetical protein
MRRASARLFFIDAVIREAYIQFTMRHLIALAAQDSYRVSSTISYSNFEQEEKVLRGTLTKFKQGKVVATFKSIFSYAEPYCTL